MKRYHFADLVILFVTSISLKNVNCDGQLSTKQNRKLNLTLSAILPLLEKTAEFQSSQRECSRNLRPDALHTVSALYYALDSIERDETLTTYFTFNIDVIENCNDSVLEMKHLSNVIERLQVEPIYAENATIGVVYLNDFAKLKYSTIFQSFPNFPLISCSGPPAEIANMNEIKRDQKDGFITVTSRHIFIVDVIFEILKLYNVKHIAVFNYACNDNKFVEFFENRAHELAEKDGVCIGNPKSIYNCWSSPTMNSTFPGLSFNDTYSTVDVIICNCGIEGIGNLKKQLQNYGKKYVVIAGNLYKPWKKGEVPWTSDLGELYYVTPTQQYDEKFRHFYLTGNNSQRYPYFREIGERYFKTFHSENTKEETFKNTLKDTYNNNSDTAINIIKSIHIIAHAMKKVFDKSLPFSRIAIKENLRDVNFKLFDSQVSFTKYRGLPKFEKFDIHKFQKIENVSDTFVKVGEYSKHGDNDDDMSSIRRETSRIRGNLNVQESDFQDLKKFAENPCGKPCDLGQFKKLGKNPCCWDCVECDEFEVSKGDSISCEKCENDSAPNENKTACISVSVIFELPTRWTDVENLISIVISSLSIVLTVIVLCVFIKYQNTPAVKSTTKELCYIMFAGIILVNVTLLVSKVTQSFKTADVKVVPAIGFTMVYAALLVKTNRIARILIPSKHKFANIHPTYVSLKAQITITSILIGIEIVICWFAVQFHDPGPSTGGGKFILRKYYLNGVFFSEIFGFVALLIVLCTYYAIKTRHLPTNFSETKRICFAMYATAITAVAFSLVYFTSKNKILAINLCASINSLTIMIFLFSPKLYVILWRPERNTKAYFSPIKANIRSFIGNTSRSGSRGPVGHSLENIGPQCVDYLKENIQDSITKVIKELDDILDVGSKADKEKIKKNVNDDNLETEDIWQKAYPEVIKKVRSCHIELNHIQESYIHLKTNN